ncbi:MAG: hypothetical protein P1U41_07700 [Vicingaceae bacterium]|nr:hypothetical protein [Vicingaceae bacterium]
MNYNSTIIALAWPNTKVVKEGKWYDYPMQWLGFIKDGKYNAGHAAFLIVNHQNNRIEYFDFGRYHTPNKYGRVRDRVTDPDIEIKLNAIIEDGKIENIPEILLERYYNKACHGDGKLTAAIVTNVDFDKAYAKVKQLQSLEAIPYGPFELKGSTCSRLVVQVVYESTDNWLTKLFIKAPYTISATPRSNKKVLNDKPYYYEVNNGVVSKHKNKWYWLKRISISGNYQSIPQTA